MFLPPSRPLSAFLVRYQPGVGRGSAASSKPRGRGFRPKAKKPVPSGARLPADADGAGAPRRQQPSASWQSNAASGGGAQLSANSGVRLVGCCWVGCNDVNLELRFSIYKSVIYRMHVCSKPRIVYS